MNVLRKGITMKKILIIMMLTLVSSNYAFEDLQSTTTYKKEEQKNTFLDATSPRIEEYEDVHNSLSHIDEYDQAITDNVTPPQVSPAEAMFKEALGALLIRYISLRETARTYFTQFKNVLVQWYHTIIKS
jgi:hypothetical protein